MWSTLHIQWRMVSEGAVWLGTGMKGQLWMHGCPRLNIEWVRQSVWWRWQQLWTTSCCSVLMFFWWLCNYRRLMLVWRRTLATLATHLSCGFASGFLVPHTRCAARQRRFGATGYMTSRVCCGNRRCTTAASDVRNCCVNRSMSNHPVSCHSVAPTAWSVPVASTSKVAF